MKMYIPEIGDKITLTSDWTFRLFEEGRNTALWNLLGMKQRGDWIQRLADGKRFYCGSGPHQEGWGWFADDGEKLEVMSFYNVRDGKVPELKHFEDEGTPATLKAGQRLSVDRVYIRKGASDFSSITFNYIGAPKGSGRVRFWAKLADVNGLEFERTEQS